MSLVKQRIIDAIAVLSSVLILGAIVGCGRNGPATHPVTGKIELPGGDVSFLAGHTVEIALRSDPQVRAAGEILPDGTFSLQTVRASNVLSGATAGEYQARIVISDDDGARQRAAAKALPARYLQFEKSGWAVRVPSEETVALPVLRR